MWLHVSCGQTDAGCEQYVQLVARGTTWCPTFSQDEVRTSHGTFLSRYQDDVVTNIGAFAGFLLPCVLVVRTNSVLLMRYSPRGEFSRSEEVRGAAIH